jgi:TonB family protein
MKVVIRGNRARLRSWGSFSFSGLIHGSILAWVAFGTVSGPPEPRRSLYDLEIRPSEHHIVWYSLRNRLPDVTPAGPRDPRPPRARFKFSQTLVAGHREDDRPPQMIWTPAPEVRSAKLLPLPNVVAVTPAPQPVRAFTPPPEQRAPVAQAPLLPQAPEVAAALNANRLSLPAAGPAGPVRTFTAPPEARIMPAAPALPEAPMAGSTALVGGTPVLDPSAMRAPVRAFSRPVESGAKTSEPASLPAAPGVSGPLNSTEASLAIAGLNPTVTPDIPEPPGSREAGFSAGPALRPEGGTGTATTSMLEVPGLLARGGDTKGQPTLVGRVLPFTREKLADAARIPPAVPAAPVPHAGEAPEAVLRGRFVYTVAFQMPNVTSYSGSWKVWFAEHEANAQAENMLAPVPLRKVDPKYIASAAAEGVAGKVRLFGVIRKDGHVDHIVLLKSLDARLDQSSTEALGKWMFEPARRNGVPVDVDAVFEIPFQLAPKPAK